LPPDLGSVGVVEGIDPDIIRLLHSRGFIPVIMPIGVGAEGESFDIDADEVAARIAVVLQAEKLILMTDAPGVSDRNGSLITGARMSEIEAAVADRRIDVARHPGLLSALDAIRNGVPSSHIIDGRIPSALLLEVLTSGGVGTLILSDAGPHFLDDSRHYLARPVPA
jgi:acetylglutamate kinase